MSIQITEKGWKDLAQKFEVKDNGLQRALREYEALDENEHDERLKDVAAIGKFATALKRDREVAAMPPVSKYLTDLLNAAQTEQRQITKAKAEAAQAAKTAALAQKKAEADTKKREQEQAREDAQAEEESEEEEEEVGDSLTRLKRNLQTLKTSQKPYYFLVCDARPYGLVVSKRDITKSMQHRKELAQLAGGTGRLPKFGQCFFDGTTKLVFEMAKPPTGLARILQKWLKDNTGLAVKVMVGTESSEDVEEEPSEQE